MKSPLWPSEAQTIPKEAVRKGLWGWEYAESLTWLGAMAALLMLWPLHGLGALVLAIPLARLWALDATAYLLPHLYTVPLMVVGVLFGQGVGVLPWLLLVLVVREGVMRWPKPLGISGGDFMLFGVMLAWLPLHQACLVVAVGCFLWLPMAWRFPKRDVPLGVPVIAAWALFSAASVLPYADVCPIYLP